MSATHITRRVTAEVQEQDEARLLPWRPISQTISIPRQPPNPRTLDEKQARTKRESLASSANARYDEWKQKNPSTAHAPATSASIVSHHFPKFRPDRAKSKELAGEWASADRVLPERERIDRAVADATAAFLQNPPYPKQGGGVKNVEFSYMSAGYNYRQRQPSKEVSGTWPIMRTRAITESARINEQVASQSTRDTLGGGRWTIDHRYGNPPTFTPLTTGEHFRQPSPRKWIGPQSPPHTAPHRRITTGNKWRGGFKTDFPPRTATAEPLDGATPWLHHTTAFEDRFHDTVAVHIPESIKHGGPTYRPNRLKTAELTGADATNQFWPQHTGDHFLPNPAQTCTWNTTVPPSPLPPRAYPKSPMMSPRPATGLVDAGGQGLVSASEVHQSGST